MYTSEKYIRLWLWTGILLICIMVIIGGITRLTGSGLSIVEWKPVTGILPPLNEAQWEEAFGQYRQFPEYQKLNYYLSLEQFKQIYFWEYLHRLIGRIIGLIFLLPFAVFYFKGWLTKKLLYSLAFIFMLGGLQGFMGWYMVKSGLINLPHVSHFRLATHQILALLLMGALLWTVLSLTPPKNRTSTPGLRFVSILSLSLLLLQIALGALVAGLKAGFSFNDFPWIENSIFPPANLVTSKAFLYNGVVLQFIHRWLAFVVVMSFILLMQMARPGRELFVQARLLVILGIAQLGLGILTLLLKVPVVLGVVHQFLAIVVFLILIRIIHLNALCQSPGLATRASENRRNNL